MDLTQLSISQIHTGVKNKEFSCVELTRAFLDNIAGKNKEIFAFISVAGESALAKAEEIDEKISRGDDMDILAGVPCAVKDNILAEGMKCTAGSKMLENYTAPYDATVVTKLKNQNAVILGKTNLDEFAMGSSTENSAFKVTHNPFDLARVPGGSSGGSAASVSAGEALAALGSDTGGSIRQPAGFCGVVGLKPTYGAVSRYGLVSMSSSLDQIGPIAKTVEDAAILFQAIAGGDELDATSVDVKYGDILSPKLDDVKKLRVGLPKEYFSGGLEKEVEDEINDAIKLLKSLGLQFKEISLPHTKYALSCYYIIMPAEVSANLARYDGIRYSRINADRTQIDADKNRNIRVNPRSNPRQSALEEIYFSQRGEGFGNEVKRRIILGTFVLSHGYYDAYYTKAQKVRRLIKEDFNRVFDEPGVDVVLAPVSPTKAFKIGEKTDDPLSMYLSDIFTIPANLAGLPAISIPTRNYADRTLNDADNISVDPRGNPRKSAILPVGFQLIGKPFREADILGIGQFYEKLMTND